jgi:hypothetical protein
MDEAQPRQVSGFRLALGLGVVFFIFLGLFEKDFLMVSAFYFAVLFFTRD